MAIDPDTTAAFERIADKLHERISEVAKEGRADSKAILDQVQENARETTAIGVKLDAHASFDNVQFERIDGELAKLDAAIDQVDDKAVENKVGLTKIGAGAIGGGGIVTAAVEWFRSLSE